MNGYLVKGKPVQEHLVSDDLLRLLRWDVEVASQLAPEVYTVSSVREPDHLTARWFRLHR